MKIVKSAYAVACLAIGAAVLFAIPSRRQTEDIPGNLRDALNSGGAIETLGSYAAPDVALPSAQKINFSVRAEESCRVGASASNSETLELTKSYLERSVQADYVKNDTYLLSSYSKMLSVLNKSKIRIRNVKCKGRFEYYVAYVEGGNDALNMFFCDRFSYLPTGSKAQTVIHELSHITLNTSELEASRLETIAAYLGGRSPELNGYNDPDFMEDIVGLEDSVLKRRDFDYFILMNVRTPDKFRVLKLKTYAIYKNAAGVAYMLKRICGEDTACKLAAVAKKDEFGVSVMDNLTESGVNAPEIFVKTAISRR